MTQTRRVRPTLVRLGPIMAATLLIAWAPLSRSVEALQERSDSTSFDDSGLPPERDFPPPAGHVSLVEGRATLLRDDESIELEENELALEGDRLTTERGRVQLLFTDGSRLSLDEATELEILEAGFVHLIRGRIAVTVERRSPANHYRVDANGVITWLRPSGEYRIAAASPPTAEVHITTLRGVAEAETRRDRVLVRAGYETYTSADDTTLVTHPVPVSQWTGFDRWIEWNDRGYSQPTGSYLPGNLSMYAGVLDAYGAWQYEPAHGYVWYPAVDMDWQPYSTGRWSAIGSYGWTWIGTGRWSWPTHHYGRWGYSGTRWYWIPGQRWAPAWVTWASSPGYVAWCPVGYAGGPQLSIGLSFSAWRGWSVVPSRTFSGRTVYAQRDRVPFGRVGSDLVVRGSAPVRPTRLTTAPRADREIAQPRQGYGVGPAPRQPGMTPRAAQPPTERESARPAPRQPGVDTPRLPSRVAAPTERTAPSATRQPTERQASPRFPSRTTRATPSPFERRPSPDVASGPPTRPAERTGANNREVPAQPVRRGAERPARPEPDPPSTGPTPGGFRRAPDREPAATSDPGRPQPQSRPGSVERSSPRPRGAGSEGEGRAVPRAQPRNGSRGR